MIEEETTEKSANEKDDFLVVKAQKGNKDAQEFILKKYKNLVKSNARKFHINGADSEDLIQEGMIGLYKAIRDYDKSKGIYFHVFAKVCISRQIMTAVSAANRRKHSPLNDYISLNASTEGEDGSLENVLENQTTRGPEEIFIEKEDSKNLRKAIEQVLTKKEIKIVDLYLQGYTYAQMSEIIGISDKGISSAISRAKKKLLTKTTNFI